jgi:hypothetical protein
MMTEPARPAENADDSVAANYQMVCLSALAVLFFVLLRRNMAPWNCLPVAVGLLGVWQRWRLGPFLTLTTLAILLIWLEPWGDARWVGYRPTRTFRLQDWFLCVAVLAYFSAHYRLQSLTYSIFPTDRRRHVEPDVGPGPGAPLAPGTGRRDSRLAMPVEILWLLMALPICALLAQILWKLLPERSNIFDVRPRVWQGIVTGWFLALGLFVAHALLRYGGWRRQSPRAARLQLLDTLWQETRREQRSLNHWLAWARLRRKRTKERS